MGRFHESLWESEKQHWAQLLRLDWPMKHENGDADTSPVPEWAKTSANVGQDDSQGAGRVHGDPRSDAARESETDTTKHRIEAAEAKSDSEVEEKEDEIIDEQLEWLRTEWESFVQLLRQRDSNFFWADVP